MFNAILIKMEEEGENISFLQPRRDLIGILRTVENLEKLFIIQATAID